MIIELLLATVIYLACIWLGNFIIHGIFFLIDFFISRNKSETVASIFLIITTILHLAIGLYFQFYLLMRLIGYFYSKHERIPVMILASIVLGYSLMKSVEKAVKRTIKLDEKKFIESNDYFLKNIENTKAIELRKLRGSLLPFISLFGTILSIVLFFLCYFNLAIMNWLLRLIP